MSVRDDEDEDDEDTRLKSLYEVMLPWLIAPSSSSVSTTVPSQSSRTARCLIQFLSVDLLIGKVFEPKRHCKRTTSLTAVHMRCNYYGGRLC